MKRTNLCFLLATFSLFLSAFAYAQNYPTIDNLSRESDLIITGDVAKIISQWDENKARIWTYTTIIPLEYLQGAGKPKEVIVKMLGGEVGDIKMDVSGSPKFKVFERVLLFLQKGTNDNYRIINWDKGVYTLVDGYWVNKILKFDEFSFIGEIKKQLQSK